MKKEISILAMLLMICSLEQTMAQSNILKGRIIGLPLGGLMYSLGIGYERTLGNHFALQGLINRSGIDMSSTDGSNEVYTSVIPELKYYFKTKQALSSSFFLSCFLELQVRNITPGGEQSTDNFLVSNQQKQVSPGLLVGKNFNLSPKFHIETYLGTKYRIGNERTEEIINNSPSSSTVRYEKLGIRTGFNIAYRF